MGRSRTGARGDDHAVTGREAGGRNRYARTMAVRFVNALLALTASCTPVERPCDGGALADRAGALCVESHASDASDRARTAAAAIWRACPELPGALRVIVDLAFEFDRAVCPDFPNVSVRIAAAPAPDRRAVAAAFQMIPMVYGDGGVVRLHLGVPGKVQKKVQKPCSETRAKRAGNSPLGSDAFGPHDIA